MARCRFVPRVDSLEERKSLSNVQLIYGPHTVTIEQADGTPIVTAFTPIPGTLHLMNLNGVNFENTDLSGLDFSWSAFHGVDFLGANLEHANLSYCAFWDPDFTLANMQGTNLTDVVSWRATYSGANFTGDDLSTWWDDAAGIGWEPILTHQETDSSGNIQTIGGYAISSAISPL